MTEEELDSYLPGEEAVKFIAFIRAAAVEDNANAEIHYRLADKYFGKEKQILIEAFRGSAKSTMMEWLVIYIAAMGKLHNFGKVSFIAFIGDSMENGVKNFFRNIAGKLDRSALLRSLITVTRKTDSEMELVNTEGVELNLKGYGASALALDTKLYTDTGTLTIGSCKVGDNIYGPNGKMAKIVAKSEVFNKPSYKLVLADGRSLVLSDDHINNVQVRTSVGNKSFKEQNITTKELLALPLKASKPSSPNKYENMVYIKNTNPVEYSPKDLPVPPYLLGYALGDGSFQNQIRLHVQSSDFEELQSNLEGERLGKIYTDTRFNPENPVKSFSVKGYGNALQKLGVSYTSCKHKYVPEIYKRGSILQRVELLKGLMDSDGTIDKSGRRLRFTSVSKQLAEDVAELVRSLGGYATIIKKCNAGGYSSDKTSNFYVVFIHSAINLCKLRRKAARFNKTKRPITQVAITSITEVPSVPTQCIAIDSDDKLFLAGDYVVTHNTNIRGVRYKGARPDIAILDDITTNEAINSETIQNTINNNFYKSVIPALHPTRFKIFFIGTPISERDIIHQLSSNPKWAIHKFPIAEKFPCEEHEFKGNWEDRFPYDSVMEKYEMYKAAGKAQDFYQEYMLEITDLTTLIVDEEDIQWYDPSIIKKNKSNYNFYITTDFATSTKKSADFSTIGVWAVSSNSDWLLVDGQCIRQTMQENIDDLFRYVKKWEPLSVGIENSGQQGGFISIMQEMMMKRNAWFTFAKKPGSKELGIRPIKDKVHRFVTGVQPKFKQNKIWLPKPELAGLISPRLLTLLEELIHELSRFTLAGGVKALMHDDAIDLLNQLSEMDIYTPSNAADNSTTVVTEDGLIWESFFDDDDEEMYKNSTIF